MVHKNWTMLSAEVCCLVEQGSHFRKFGEEFKNELSTKLYFLPSNRQNVVEVSEKKQNKINVKSTNFKIFKFKRLHSYPNIRNRTQSKGWPFSGSSLVVPRIKKTTKQIILPNPFSPWMSVCVCAKTGHWPRAGAGSTIVVRKRAAEFIGRGHHQAHSVGWLTFVDYVFAVVFVVLIAYFYSAWERLSLS